MTPGEVQGLQKLAMSAGGSLTINPQTGLPEAGFLSNMLPTIIGIGVGAATGNPFLGSAVAGGLGYAKSGNLMQAFSAGLGAYTGSGLLSGLESAGAGALTSEATQQAALASGLQNTGSALGQNALGGMSAGELAAFQAEQSAQQVAAQAAATQAQQTAANASYLDKLSAGAKSAFNNPKAFLAATPTGEGATGFSNKTNLMGLAGSGLASAGPDLFASQPTSGVPTTAQDQYDLELAKYHLSPNFKGYVPAQPNPYYKATYPTYRAARGGVTPLARSASMPDVGIARDNDPDTSYKDPYAATAMRLQKLGARTNLKGYPIALPKTNIKGLGDIQGMAAGGNLGGYSDGGHLLKGPGDGMSDSIPASINKKQPAALADGEFVVPADVVSHLGNGSTDAGAKKLYAMMDKVRRARTGKKQQGKQINANKFMPA
jgi:hypothetical protein